MTTDSNQWTWMMVIIVMIAICAIVVVVSVGIYMFCRCKKKVKRNRTVGISGDGTNGESRMESMSDTDEEYFRPTSEAERVHYDRFTPRGSSRDTSRTFNSTKRAWMFEPD